jgi:hypothetical protein
MQAPILAALTIGIGICGIAICTAAHADCPGSICPPDEQARSTQAGTELTLEHRIENALEDLEIWNARASATNLDYFPEQN